MSNEWNNAPISIDKENIINQFRNATPLHQKAIIYSLNLQLVMMRITENESIVNEIQRQIDELNQISQERRN